MRRSTSVFFALTVAVGTFMSIERSHAALFKIDFGSVQNEAVEQEFEVDIEGAFIFGSPTPVDLEIPEPLTDWDVIPTWSFDDPNSNVTEGSASIEGTANADGTEVTWNLTDFSGTDNDVTLTMLDNTELPPAMLGQIHNNPTHEGFRYVDFNGNTAPSRIYEDDNGNPFFIPRHVANIAYDQVIVPYVVKDDYNYRNPDTSGTEVLMRFGNLDPGFYNVTVFEGRTTDANRTGKIWVDDVNGANAPAEQNTGNYGSIDESGDIADWGQPRTMTVAIEAGQYLWFAEMEDNSGGISGMIIRSVDFAPAPADVTTSPGLFKIDFGHIENERAPDIVDEFGNPTGEVGDPPAPLDVWNVIPTWTFTAPNSEVTEGSSSVEGEANAEGTEVTWPLTDFSKDNNPNVTMTIMDNAALSESLGQSPALGQIANNPVQVFFEPTYNGVVIPAVVKDDYNYRNSDAAGTELLMRFAGLNPGTYDVTVFEGRTSDANRTGKIWVDDINGANAPAEQNTGNYAGQVDGVPTPDGQPRTLTVTIGAGEFLWFAEMEDNSGGISGMIIRGTGASDGPPPSEGGTISIALSGDNVTLTWEGGGTLQRTDTLPGIWTDVDGATSPYEAAATGDGGYFRVN